MNPLNAFTDVISLFEKICEGFSREEFLWDTPLEEIVIKSCGTVMAYIDDRKKATALGVDILSPINQTIEDKRFETLRTTTSQRFPDFLFQSSPQHFGSILELKDSKGTNIASFNSTIPSTYKTLQEIDQINGKRIVSDIAIFVDRYLRIPEETYLTAKRRCFYLVRTNSRDKENVKISLVDGSFFETVPKEELISSVFLKILDAHRSKLEPTFSADQIETAKTIISKLNNQSLIACSQTINGAAVKPRFRIMTEVTHDANPHTYPRIPNKSFNLILPFEDTECLCKAINMGSELTDNLLHKLDPKKRYIVQSFNLL
jgi:hypothetical protein